jgi:hypothetical protein
VRTDIAGFFGFAERGPVPDPAETNPAERVKAAVKLTSWNDFRLIFGGFLPYSYLAYAVRGFFATGGATCYVVRVGVAATPPATALMPLAAAITSTQAARLAASASAGDTQIQVDSAAVLKAGTSIAIGDPAFNQRLIVTGVIDETVEITDATQHGAGLSSAHAAGDPVFALSGPSVAAQVTTIAAATSGGATQIQLGSSDVTGIDVGHLIAVGDPVNGECVAVASIVDDQTITVQPALQSAHAAGDPVYSIEGSRLNAAAAKGATSLQIAETAGFLADDLVSIEGGGVTEFRVMTAAPVGSTIQLGRALEFDFAFGSIVRKYSAAMTVTAYSAGAWGNGIKLQITPLDPGNAVTHFSLRVTVDQGVDPAQPPQEEFYPLLSLDPQDPYPQSSPDGQTTSISAIYAPAVVNDASELIRISPAPPQQLVQGTQLLVNSGTLSTNELYLEGGSDGTLSTPNPPAPPPVPNPCLPKTSAAAATPPPPYPPPPNATTQDFRNALDVLGLIDEIAILSCPDAAGPPPQTPLPSGSVGWSMTAIQQAMVAQCAQLKYRVAVLDTPMSQQPAQALAWLTQHEYSDPAARYAAVYYPWLRVPDELNIEGPNRTVPPSGHVAGAYAYTDNNSGVQKPPANVELQFVSDVELAVTNQQQGFLNPAGINAIRPFPGRGVRVWGARSISQNPDWIYIHTRRLISMIEDSVEKASQWIVFRTNDDNLRRMLTHSLNVFLESIWRAGGLKGARASESYFVKCDSTNNTQTTIDAGLLICQVGVAIAAPMEFLVFELRRSVAGSQVVEA